MWTFKFGVQFQSAQSAPRAFQVALVLKNPPANAGDIRDLGLIPGSGISPGGGHGNPLQYSCLGIPWTEEPGRPWSIELQSRTQLKRLSMHARCSKAI